MPRYTYHCNSCDATYEEIHRMSVKKTVCRECEGEGLERVPNKVVSKKSEPLQRPGALVDSYIRKVKEEVELEKKKLKEREA